MNIVNAKDSSLVNLSNALPDVSDGIRELLQPVTVQIVTRTTVDGYTTEATTSYNTFATKQPFQPQQTKILPEGQRQWRWYSIWMMNDCLANVDDVIVLFGVNYKVQQKESWQEYGYSRYDSIEDYT